MIVIASDHAGVELRKLCRALLEGQGHEVHDLGPFTSEPVDYPEFAHRLAGEIARGRAAFGVLICGTGIGMSMTANRHRGVRAALCHDAFTAEMARRHNDANVLCLGARVTGPGVVEQLLRIFLSTPFDGGRHQRRTAGIELEEP